TARPLPVKRTSGSLPRFPISSTRFTDMAASSPPRTIVAGGGRSQRRVRDLLVECEGWLWFACGSPRAHKPTARPGATRVLPSREEEEVASRVLLRDMRGARRLGPQDADHEEHEHQQTKHARAELYGSLRRSPLRVACEPSPVEPGGRRQLDAFEVVAMGCLQPCRR